MNHLVEHVDVWPATIEDRPGGLSVVLTTLRNAGADLQFIVARRVPEESGQGVVFVSPLQGEREKRPMTCLLGRAPAWCPAPGLFPRKPRGFQRLSQTLGVFEGIRGCRLQKRVPIPG
jgi:hypothetical protein